MAALYFVKKMVEGYGSDSKITRVLDEQAVYVVPRLNPNGAELALAEKPQFIRSGTRPYPYEEKRDGLHEEDLDGDGRVLQMRIADPTGDWKVSEDDPRLMLKRGLDEEGGKYYRLFAEGLIENYDGHMIVPAPPLQGLDFNRNFPGAWRPEGEQHGAGDFPGSEPEIPPWSSSWRSTRMSSVRSPTTPSAAPSCAPTGPRPTTRWRPTTCGSLKRSASGARR